jgi:sigma-54 specific flagellar transcriptional regulator A
MATCYRRPTLSNLATVPATDQRGIETVRDSAMNGAKLPSGSSLAIRQVIRLARQVAGHDSSVLILGESGTGKEVLARAIHDSSPRRRGPFVAVNCGAIPAELLESELFGHEKGSFTGAISARRGRFEVAEGGTLFLDEIGDMSLGMQVKLLRVLQERVFERVGNHQSIPCNVRIVAATHRNLDAAIETGHFRGDLFYRLNVFPIEMPPLRERIDDLDALLLDFVENNRAAGRKALEFSPAARAALCRYHWPGNVRELSNLVERLSILQDGRMVRFADLPFRYQSSDVGADTELCQSEPASPEFEMAPLPIPLDLATPAAASGDSASLVTQLPDAGLDLREYLLTIERDLVAQALARSGGVVAHAAKLLGLRRTTLVEKLRKLEFPVGDASDD